MIFRSFQIFLFFFEVKNGATMFHLLSSILDLEICSHHDFEVKKPFIGERRRQKTVALWVASKSSFFFIFRWIWKVSRHDWNGTREMVPTYVRKGILSLLEPTTSFTSAPSFMRNKVKRNLRKVSCFNCKNVKRGTSVLRVRSKQASFFLILWPFYCWHEAFFTLQQSFLSFSRKKANISGLRFQKSVVVVLTLISRGPKWPTGF